jgi:hypothetical protein
MSDYLLRYIPTDPQFVPTEAAAAIAQALVAQLLPAADSVVANFKNRLVFMDAGGNWDGVLCPACGADAEPWWGDAMDAAAPEGHFESLQVRAGCCGANVSLNELTYAWPVAFGRFVLEAMNPGAGAISAQDRERIGAALGCPVLDVQAHI